MDDGRNGCRRLLALLFIALAGLGLLSLFCRENGLLVTLPGQPLPDFPTAEPYTPWPTPPVATTFSFPLLPATAYGPYIQGVTGPLAVDTRYDVQNPALGNRANCFRDRDGEPVPFSQLYHAGVDLFALDNRGQVVWRKAAHAPVHAVGDGVVVFVMDAGQEGNVVGVEHRRPEGEMLYSVYWHVSHVQVQEGQPVTKGQIIGVVKDMGANSHLHWEMRTFRDGSNIFPAGTAGARGGCNRQIAGVGYTWDDDPLRAHPDYYGYRRPTAFITAEDGLPTD